MARDTTVAGRLTPPFARNRKTWRACCAFIERLMSADPLSIEDDGKVERIRRDALAVDAVQEHQAYLAVVISVLCDLRLQGWSFEIETAVVVLKRPCSHLDPSLERERVRRMHAINRDVQLIKQSVRTFVRGLERKRLGPKGWVSVFSLMRDGRELAAKLRQLDEFSSEKEQLDHLATVVQPYLQVASDGIVCEHTGLPISEIWRYFRHTWASEYQTVPGRNLMLLIRDAAAPFHPVIGIAALTSPVVHLQIRDQWIGWAPQQFVNALREAPSVAWAKWIDEKLKQLIADVYTDDLLRDHIIRKSEITYPREETIAALEEEALRSRAQHRLHPSKGLHKNPTKAIPDSEWLKRTISHLFRSKRCTALAELLRAKLRLRHAGFIKATKESLEKALSTSEGRLAAETIRKQVKAIHIGNDVLDIAVCGAVAPYSDVLGGKLVAMLLTSPEVVKYYARRYGRSNSIIASSMAGRRIARQPRLTALTTTSLYGAEPNQYTRVKIPACEIGCRGDGRVEYRNLGLTRGQGSYHFSALTVDAVEVLISQMSHNRSVNSIFGEGVNPRLRKIRTGLDACGFPTDEVLTHGSPRVVYGVALAENLRDVLTEKCKRPKYVFDQDHAESTTEAIAGYWRRRWLLRRASRAEVIERVEQHTLVSPIEHGARVPLPRIFDEEALFFHQDS